MGRLETIVITGTGTAANPLDWAAVLSGGVLARETGRSTATATLAIQRRTTSMRLECV